MFPSTGVKSIDRVLNQAGWDRPRTRVALDMFTSELVDRTVAIRSVPEDSHTAPMYLWRLQPSSKQGLLRHEFVRSAVLYYLLSIAEHNPQGAPQMVHEFAAMVEDKDMFLQHNTSINFYKNLSK